MVGAKSQHLLSLADDSRAFQTLMYAFPLVSKLCSTFFQVMVSKAVLEAVTFPDTQLQKRVRIIMEALTHIFPGTLVRSRCTNTVATTTASSALTHTPIEWIERRYSNIVYLFFFVVAQFFFVKHQLTQKYKLNPKSTSLRAWMPQESFSSQAYVEARYQNLDAPQVNQPR